MSTTSLFDSFSPVSEKAWKQKVQYDLKGADYNEKLVWESPEGIQVKPFYHLDSYRALPALKKGTQGWKISQEIQVSDPSEANKEALKALDSGAEHILFSVMEETMLTDGLFQDIPLSHIPITLACDFLSKPFLQAIPDGSYITAQIGLRIDPIGHLAQTGNWYHNEQEDMKRLLDVLTKRKKNVLSVDAALYQNAGANMVQQLAYALAHANEYLNTFEALANANLTFHFKLAIGSNYFFEIAKIRALRMLWELLASEYGVSEICTISAIPSRRNKTLYDFNTNMLRTTTESMAAVLGGADQVANLRYDAVYHKDNEFASRIALNQLLLLKNESYFDKVANAPDGSYYIDSITAQLAEKALKLFKSIEKGGGFLAQLKNHTIQKKIAESAAVEEEKFRSGTKVLVGTNAYEYEGDLMKETIEINPFLAKNIRKTQIQPLLGKRLAESKEQKRLNDE